MHHELPRNRTSFQDGMMSSLTYSEQILLGSILTAAIAGMGIKHWRDERRERPMPLVSMQSAPFPRANETTSLADGRRP